MTQFSKKTEQIIIDDIKDIQKRGREISSLCNECLQMMKQDYVGDEWSEVTTKILECCDVIHYIMIEKRGRF
jgi:hypothetical protein